MLVSAAHIDPGSHPAGVRIYLTLPLLCPTPEQSIYLSGSLLQYYPPPKKQEESTPQLRLAWPCICRIPQFCVMSSIVTSDLADQIGFEFRLELRIRNRPRLGEMGKTGGKLGRGLRC
jgi:hypothetical protein